MNLFSSTLKTLLSLILFAPFYSYATEKPKTVEDSFIVVWDESKSKAQRSNLAAYGGASVKSLKYLKTVDIVTAKDKQSIKQQMLDVAQMPGVKGVYPNFVRQASSFNASAILPDDPLFGELWGLENDNDHDVNAPEAWDVTTGSNDVYVVVIDTGIDYAHEDLSENMWVNTDEVPNNDIDDDGNGWVDDIYGIDTVNQDGDPMDDNIHGTHVAGTIAAKGNNAIGVTGVAWNAGLIACKFLDQNGFGSDAGALECLDYVLSLKNDKGLNIVATNNSWGGGGYSQPLYDAIFAQLEAGVLFIAAAGNSSLDTDQFTNYPSGYDLDNIISVAASDENGGFAWFSNYGATTVDIVAPGDSIFSTAPSDSYEYLGGTSMAAPHVSGAAVLLKSNQPELTWSGIKNTLLTTSRENSSYEGRVLTGDLRLWDESGEGAINCEDQTLVTRFSPALDSSSVPFGDTFTISVSSINCASAVDVPALTSGQGEINLVDDGSGADVTAGDGIFTADVEVTWLGENVFSFEGLSDFNFSVIGFEAPLFQTLAYDYVEIEGQDLFASDDSSHRIDLDFDIQLPDGVTTNVLNVWSNGLVAFDENYYSYGNGSLPLYYSSHLFAPLWTDLYPGNGGVLSYEVLGESPNRRVVIEYRDFTDCCYFENSDDYTVTFEVIFYESQSVIDVFYKDANAPQIYGAHLGQGATIGYQNGEQAVQYSYNEAVLEDEMGLRLMSASFAGLPSVTAFEVDGLFRPFQRLSLYVDIDDEGIEEAYTVQVDQNDGNGFQDVVLGESIPLSLDEGDYEFKLSVANDDVQFFQTISFSVFPFSAVELELIDLSSTQSRLDTIDEIALAPAEFGLVSEEDTVARESAAIEEGQQNVVSSPSSFGLYTESEIEQSAFDAEQALLVAIAENPTMFGYVTMVQNVLDVEAAVVTGQQNVTSSPADFELVPLEAHDSAVAVSAQQAEEAVIDNPNTFGLTPIVNGAEDLNALASGALHLVGLSTDLDNLEEVFIDVRFVWVYRDGAFVGWSPDSALRDQVTNSGYTLLTSISAGEGVWVSK